MLKYLWIAVTALVLFAAIEWVACYTNRRIDAMQTVPPGTQAPDEAPGDVPDEKPDEAERDGNENDPQAEAVPSAQIRKYSHTWMISCAMALIYALMMVFLYDHMTSFVACIQMTLLYAATAAAAVTDFKINKIPNLITFSLFASGVVTALIKLVVNIVHEKGDLTEFATSWLLWNLVAAVGIVLLLAVVSRLTHNGFGYGDVKLMGAFCFVGGFAAMISSAVAALILCTLFGIGAMLAKKKGLKDQLPFAPFFYLGFIAAAMVGLV